MEAIEARREPRVDVDLRLQRRKSLTIHERD